MHANESKALPMVELTEDQIPMGELNKKELNEEDSLLLFIEKKGSLVE